MPTTAKNQLDRIIGSLNKVGPYEYRYTKEIINLEGQKKQHSITLFKDDKKLKSFTMIVESKAKSVTPQLYEHVLFSLIKHGIRSFKELD